VCCDCLYRQLTQDEAPHTPRKCHLDHKNMRHVELVAKFAGETFDEKKVNFCLQYYRIVRIHSGKQIDCMVARAMIAAWVTSCTSDMPVILVESPTLDPAEAPDSTHSSGFESICSSENSFHSDIDSDFFPFPHDHELGHAPSRDDLRFDGF
jgi:hypothetical protein